MTLAGLTDQYAAGHERLPGSARFDTRRRAALARFGELGLPGRRIETWHYTDLGRLADKTFEFVARAPDEAVLAAAQAALTELKLETGSPRCVFVDGQLIEALSVLAADEALAIESLAAAPERFLGEPPTDATALEALNTAFAGAGARLRVAGKLAGPVHLVFIGSGRNLAPQLKLAIELAPAASATLVQHFIDLADTDPAHTDLAWLNLVTAIEQSESSELSILRLQQHGPARYQTALTRARLAARARFASTSIELGGGLVRNELAIALAGPGAHAEVSGLALTREQQHCDTRIEIDHRAPSTTSRQNYRAIAADASRSVFNGKVTVREGAQHIEARQRNDNLLLSSKAEIDTKPELEIYADQVICSHGATVGELSEDHLFYLQSRGIDAESARDILTTAFADVIVQRIADEDFRARAGAAVAARLPRRAGIA
jgi:Fe-S cluster assembly protein SufD